MKVSYNPSNESILTVVRDSENLQGAVLEIPNDNLAEDILRDLSKYRINLATKTIERRPYILLSTTATDTNANGIPDVNADGTTPFPITLIAYNSDGTQDTPAGYIVNFQSIEDTILSAYRVILANATATIAAYSTKPGIRIVIASCNEAFIEPFEIEFV